MAATDKTIDQIIRTLTALTGAERIPMRDNNGDFKISVDNLKKAFLGNAAIVKEISGDYTIQNDDYYTEYHVDTSSGDVTVTFPDLDDYNGPSFFVKNVDGTNDAICAPAGTDKINSYNANVNITEKWGWWYFSKDSNQWVGLTDGNSTVIEERGSSNVIQNNAATTNYYDSGLTLSLTPGIWDIEYRGHVQGREQANAVQSMFLYLGLDTNSGTIATAPDIDYEYAVTKQTGDQTEDMGFSMGRLYPKYVVSSNIDIYMKFRGYTEENTLERLMLVVSNTPEMDFWMRARRIT